jgi:RNA polymerase sigma-70 factor (ECF subfamily)
MERLIRMTDQELALESRQGRREAFDMLVLRYQQKVYEFVYRKVRNAAVADELVQEAFVKAYRGLAGIRNAETFGPWLFTIAFNCCRSWFRSKGRGPEWRELHPESAAAAVEDPSDRAARVVALQEAVQTLPDDVRKILRLRYERGKTCEEISKLLSMPIGTVMSRMSRAYMKLRAYLEERLR